MKVSKKLKKNNNQKNNNNNNKNANILDFNMNRAIYALNEESRVIQPFSIDLCTDIIQKLYYTPQILSTQSSLIIMKKVKQSIIVKKNNITTKSKEKTDESNIDTKNIANANKSINLNGNIIMKTKKNSNKNNNNKHTENVNVNDLALEYNKYIGYQHCNCHRSRQKNEKNNILKNQKCYSFYFSRNFYARIFSKMCNTNNINKLVV